MSQVATSISVDVRNLFTVRVAKFDVKAGPPKQVDITFEIQADKTRANMRVSLSYGKFPNEEIKVGSGIFMNATLDNGDLKDFDVIKQNAWDVVQNTTDANKMTGSGTHADVSWDDIKAWTLQETSKPSIAQTINTV